MILYMTLIVFVYFIYSVLQTTRLTNTVHFSNRTGVFHLGWGIRRYTFWSFEPDLMLVDPHRGKAKTSAARDPCGVQGNAEGRHRQRLAARLQRATTHRLRSAAGRRTTARGSGKSTGPEVITSGVQGSLLQSSGKVEYRGKGQR